MKTIKFLVSTILILAVNFAFAQSDSQKIKTTTVKSYQYQKDGKSVPYKLTIFKTSTTPLKLNEKEKGQLNQDRKITPAQVTKLIYVDNDMYDDYDKYIVLRYSKEPEDSFELKPTDRGFKVVVDERYVEYIFGEGVYFVNNEDKDFFFVDEFNTI